MGGRSRCLLVGAQYFSWPTISLGCLKAAADSAPALAETFDVVIRNFVMPEPAPQRVAEALIAEAPDVLGFSCYLWNSQVFLDALPAIRRALPRALIVLGGPDAYPRADELLRDHAAVDLVALGEGELTFPLLLRAWRDRRPWNEVPGIAFRGKDGRVARTPEPALIKDLDAFPSPYLSGALTLSDADVRVTVETSRGCPFNCSFCDWPGRSQKPRNFSIDRVIAELKHVMAQGRGLQVVMLADADIFIEKKRAMELLTRAREVLAGTKIIMGMEAYFGRLDDDLMRLLDSPNFGVEGGVQTATPEALKAVNRFFHRDKIESAMKRLHELSPSALVSLQLIFGLPGDTLEGFKSTLNWALSLGPLYVAAYPALVLPGSDMGLHPERFDMVFDPKPPRRIAATSSFPAEDIRCANAIAARLAMAGRLLAKLGERARLAGIDKGRARPFLSFFETYGELLMREGLLPPQLQLEAAADPYWHGCEAASRLLADEAKRERARALLGEALGGRAAVSA